MYSEDDRQYLQMMQTNIERMASNSANYKAWAVSIVAGILAIGTSVEKLNFWLLLTIIPVFCFWYLDTFYLHLERGMRNRQKDFLNKAKAYYTLSTDTIPEQREIAANEYNKALYTFAPLMEKTDNQSKGFVSTVDRFFSKSTAPFYGSLLACVIIILLAANASVIWRGLVSCCQ